ncbi:MAG TPA: branched-chain amino acid ABC transporter permease [Candidatus Limnocylindrales bacterium]|nr:branched-chain amino acid ABC transporter permease [Candidatus Limnocylindrales bacterium]
MIDWLDSFLVTGLFGVAMIIGLALLLHLQLGLTRIANFGVVGFWGLGYYVFGVLYIQVDWPFGDPWQFLVCAAGATAVAGLAGLVVGWLISDLDTDGVLVVTLGFAAAVQILATTEADWTGGSRGLGGLRIPFDVGKVKEDELAWLLILTLVVAIIFLYARQVHRSPYGRLLIATGGNEALARSLGKSTYRTKLGLFAVTSAGMGLLGTMFGSMQRSLDVGRIGVDVTLAAMVGLVLGGSARVWGAVVGVFLTVGLFDILVRSYLPLPRDWYTQAIPVLREVIFGATLIVVLMFRPLGVLGDMRRDKLMRRLHGR